MQSSQSKHLAKKLSVSFLPSISSYGQKSVFLVNWQFLEFNAKCILSNPWSVSNSQCTENGGKKGRIYPLCFSVFLTTSDKEPLQLSGQTIARTTRYQAIHITPNSGNHGIAEVRRHIQKSSCPLCFTQDQPGSTTWCDQWWWYLASSLKAQDTQLICPKLAKLQCCMRRRHQWH